VAKPWSWCQERHESERIAGEVHRAQASGTCARTAEELQEAEKQFTEARATLGRVPLARARLLLLELASPATSAAKGRSRKARALELGEGLTGEAKLDNVPASDAQKPGDAPTGGLASSLAGTLLQAYRGGQPSNTDAGTARAASNDLFGGSGRPGGIVARRD